MILRCFDADTIHTHVYLSRRLLLLAYASKVSITSITRCRPLRGVNVEVAALETSPRVYILCRHQWGVRPKLEGYKEEEYLTSTNAERLLLCVLRM